MKRGPDENPPRTKRKLREIGALAPKRAEVLVEALPYILAYDNKTIVGENMADMPWAKVCRRQFAQRRSC